MSDYVGRRLLDGRIYVPLDINVDPEPVLAIFNASDEDAPKCIRCGHIEDDHELYDDGDDLFDSKCGSCVPDALASEWHDFESVED